MTDSLRKMVNALDRSRARTHRLTGDQVVAERGGASARKVCGSCWHVVDEQAHRRAWVTQVGCQVNERGPLRTGCFQLLNAECLRHTYPGIHVCPSCHGALSEVTW